MPREYIKGVFKSLFKSSLNLRLALPTLASQCAVCRSWPARPVCEPCIARFTPQLPRCRACALALPENLSRGFGNSPDLCADCTKHAPPLDAMLVAVTYAYPWSKLITRYKFGDTPGWAAFFSALLLQTPGVQQAFDGLCSSDLVIALPLSPERLQWRGFNQAWELASALAAQSGSLAKTDARLLLRTKHTRPQTELQREARLANVKGAFQLDPLRTSLVMGRRVVLVDDVMTSGASLFTAAAALRAAGAMHITGMAVARTAAP